VTRPGRHRIAALTVAIAAVAAACGLPNDHAPRTLVKDDVPFALLASSTTAPPSEIIGPLANLFFVTGDRLVQVQEHVTRITASEVVQGLLAGPTDDQPPDVTTAIPRETRLVNIVQTGDDILIIDLSSDILAVEGPEQKAAFAQLVYTAYALREIKGVRFRIDGEDKAIPTDNGSPTGPLIPGDFASLAPAPTP
jgi:hypothetical protein